MTAQRLVTHKLARDFSFHPLSHRRHMVGRDRDLEELPPLRENEPRMLFVHSNDHDTDALLRVRVLEPPAILLGVDMSDDDRLSVFYDSFGREIKRRRRLNRTGH